MQLQKFLSYLFLLFSHLFALLNLKLSPILINTDLKEILIDIS